MKPTHYIMAAMALVIAVLVAALAMAKQDHAEDLTAWAIERTALAEAKTKATERVRDLETQLNTANLENANEQARLKADATRRIAAANRAAASLRDTITTLRSRERPTDPTTASWFDAASTARQLVGECSERRTEVAEAADGIRTQVIGLQRYVAEVCQPPGPE
jgi:septal ring factor EnvC (AmiA/AmiB activator)